MMDLDQAKREVCSDLGYRTLNRTWAKLEIFLGLLANGGGILLMLLWTTTFQASSEEMLLAITALSLFVLGSYLAMAGHRSHLYQSSNDRVAYLFEKIRHDSGNNNESN